jgi:hypothetical protein
MRPPAFEFAGQPFVCENDDLGWKALTIETNE